MLLIATFGAGATYAALALDASVQPVRYLVPSIMFAALLAGRVTARTWPKLRSKNRRVVAVAGAAVTLCLAAGVGVMLTQRQPVQPDRTLAAWLEAHDLHNGIGDYWAASLTTLESHGAVTVRPVQFDQPHNTMLPMATNASTSWYTNQRFNFLVYDLTYWDGVDLGSATAVFGQPQHTYSVAGYVVLVWDRPFTVPAHSNVKAQV